MERLVSLLKRREDRIDFLKDLITLLIEDYELYSEDVLFRDAVEEIYSILRSAVLEGKSELIDAYELSVLLRGSLDGKLPEPKALLKEILDRLG